MNDTNNNDNMRSQITILDNTSEHYLKIYSDIALAVKYSKNKNNLEILKRLLLTTTNKKTINDLLVFAMENSTSTSSVDAVKLLIKSGADVNYQLNCYSKTILLICCSYYFNDNINLIEYLIDSGAHINAKSNAHKIALMYLVTNSFNHSHLDIIKLLIRKGSNVNCQDSFGDTSMMMSLYSNINNSIKYDTIKLLLDNKADIYIKDKEGKNILHIIKNKISSLYYSISDIYSLIFNYKNIKNDDHCEYDINFIYNT